MRISSAPRIRTVTCRAACRFQRPLPEESPANHSTLRPDQSLGHRYSAPCQRQGVVSSAAEHSPATCMGSVIRHLDGVWVDRLSIQPLTSSQKGKKAATSRLHAPVGGARVELLARVLVGDAAQFSG